MFLEPQSNYIIPILGIPNTERFPQFTESRKRQGHFSQKCTKVVLQEGEEEEEVVEATTVVSALLKGR